MAEINALSMGRSILGFIKMPSKAIQLRKLCHLQSHDEKTCKYIDGCSWDPENIKVKCVSSGLKQFAIDRDFKCKMLSKDLCGLTRTCSFSRFKGVCGVKKYAAIYDIHRRIDAVVEAAYLFKFMSEKCGDLDKYIYGIFLKRFSIGHWPSSGGFECKNWLLHMAAYREKNRAKGS